VTATAAGELGRLFRTSSRSRSRRVAAPAGIAQQRLRNRPCRGARRLYAVQADPFLDVDAWLDAYAAWTQRLMRWRPNCARPRSTQPATERRPVVTHTGTIPPTVRPRRADPASNPAGEARCAILRRAYDATIDDVGRPVPTPCGWPGGTPPSRAISRSAGTHSGDFRLRSDRRCQPPRLLTSKRWVMASSPTRSSCV